MEKKDFIKWLNENTGFSKINTNNWRELMDYAEYIWDELTINENTVTFNWEEIYWGGRNSKTIELSFEEFKYKYENCELKC